MPKLQDAQLSRVYRGLENQLLGDPSVKIDDANLIQLLAAAGDTWLKSESRVRSQLAAVPTREAKIALVKNGLSSTEANDIKKILDAGTVPLTPSARAFLSEVVGRQPPPPPPPVNGALTITGDQKVGLSGFGKAGETIEAINLSTSPSGRYHVDDTTELGKVGADGRFSTKFTGQLAPTREGDILRVRSRSADGKTSDWVTVRATGISAQDTQNAELALFRVAVSDAGNGKIDLSNMNASRQISEPGALVRFVNTRTGDAKIVKLDDVGNFPANTQLAGLAGDSFTVAVSDGTNNKNLSATIGKVTVPVPGDGPSGGVDLPDPQLHKDHVNADGTPKYKEARFRGPLFIHEPSVEDVRQGQIGDCYFPSAVAALAHVDPAAIKDMIVQNEDKTYTVTFKQKSSSTGKYTDVRVNIDGDLWVRPFGGPLYGSAGNSSELDKMELWFPLLEKAYASWKGSYDAIGNGGNSARVMQDCLGIDAVTRSISENNPSDMFAWVKKAVDAKVPVSFGTYGDSQKARYTNSGVYPDHSYSVLAYKTENGKQMIQMRNPWGESEHGYDGKNDGIFWIEASKAAKLFQTFYSIKH